MISEAKVIAALAAWPSEFDRAGLREGWVLSRTNVKETPIQCQKIDFPNECEDDGLDFTPPKLENDSDAWAIVMAGTQPHHEQARQILSATSPVEYANMCKRAGKEAS